MKARIKRGSAVAAPLICGLALRAMGGCGTTGPVDQQNVPCQTSTDCGSGYVCLNDKCTSEYVGPDGSLVLLPDGGTEAVPSDSGIPVDGGITREEADIGFGGLRDAGAESLYCQTCTTDSDCGGAGNYCLQPNTQIPISFCGVACESDSDCETGASCIAVPGSDAGAMNCFPTDDICFNGRPDAGRTGGGGGRGDGGFGGRGDGGFGDRGDGGFSGGGGPGGGGGGPGGGGGGPGGGGGGPGGGG